MMASGIVLAGGASRRMGRDKAWVELNGQPLIVRVVNALRQVCDEIVIVANSGAPFVALGARVVGDEFPDKGSLGGLYSGLNAVRNDLAVAVACDMPFLNPDLLNFLILLSSDDDVIIPGGAEIQHPDLGKPERQDTAKKWSLHPLHAVYRKTCLEPMHAAIARNDLRMIAFHDAVRVRIVKPSEIETFDPHHSSMWNVNTPEELKRANAFLNKE